MKGCLYLPPLSGARAQARASPEINPLGNKLKDTGPSTSPPGLSDLPCPAQTAAEVELELLIHDSSLNTP